MKKLFFAITCLAIILGLSNCNKLIEEPVVDETTSNQEEFVLPSNIPATITANLLAETDSEQSRTSYDADGKYTWVVDDEVCLLYVNGETTKQACVVYKVTSLENEGRQAIFTLKAGQEARISAITSGSLTNSGIAFYPSNMARPYDTENSGTTFNYSDYGTPFVTVQGNNKGGGSSDIVLLGRGATVDDVNSTMEVNFKTAMSVLKFNLTSIPSGAAKLQLVTTDANLYPWGDFSIDLEAVGTRELAKGNYLKWDSGTQHSGSTTVTTSLSGASSETKYFNVPTGSYTANTLKIRILDANDNVLMQKSIQVDFTFVRNDMIVVNLACPTVSTVYTASYATAPTLYTTKGTGVSTIRVNISSTKLSDGNYDKAGWYADNRFGGNQSGWSLNNLTSDGTNKILSTATSGQYYLNYIACSSDSALPDKLTDNQVLAYGSAPMAFITSADAAARCGHYDYAFGTIAPAAMAAKPEEASITLAVSKDASKGNMMITEFGRYSYIANGYDNTTIGVEPTTNGSPVYGLYKAANSLTGNNPGVVFSNTFDNNFFKASSTNYYLGAKGSYATATRLRLSFDNDARETGSTKDLVCWDEKATLFYSENKSSSKIEVENYCANLNLINKCTVSSNSVSGSDVAANMVDGNPETYWHSVWSGVLPFDETYGVYLTIQLPSAIKTFQICYLTRINNNVVPRSFKYWTSSDGSAWTAYSANDEDATTDETRGGARVTLPSVTAASSFTYLRVRIVKANASGVATALTSGSGSTAIAELQLYGSAE